MRSAMACAASRVGERRQVHAPRARRAQRDFAHARDGTCGCRRSCARRSSAGLVKGPKATHCVAVASVAAGAMRRRDGARSMPRAARAGRHFLQQLQARHACGGFDAALARRRRAQAHHAATPTLMTTRNTSSARYIMRRALSRGPAREAFEHQRRAACSACASIAERGSAPPPCSSNRGRAPSNASACARLRSTSAQRRAFATGRERIFGVVGEFGIRPAARREVRGAGMQGFAHERRRRRDAAAAMAGRRHRPGRA